MICVYYSHDEGWECYIPIKMWKVIINAMMNLRLGDCCLNSEKAGPLYVPFEKIVLNITYVFVLFKNFSTIQQWQVFILS